MMVEQSLDLYPKAEPVTRSSGVLALNRTKTEVLGVTRDLYLPSEPVRSVARCLVTML